jgi:hypothetical protein
MDSGPTRIYLYILYILNYFHAECTLVLLYTYLFQKQCRPGALQKIINFPFLVVYTPGFRPNFTCPRTGVGVILGYGVTILETSVRYKPCCLFTDMCQVPLKLVLINLDQKRGPTRLQFTK